MRTRTALAFLVGSACGLSIATQAAAQEQEAAPSPPPPYARLTYQLTIDRASTTDAERQGKPLVPHTESTMTVTLGPRVVEMARAGKRRTLLDYEAGLAYDIDGAVGTYRSEPLIAHFGFLEIEMFNRKKLGRVLAAANLEDPAFAPVELSILFGWPDSRDDADIQSTVENGTTIWRLGDNELTRWTPSEHALDDAQGEAFNRFLQRQCHLHWEVREEIFEDGHAPAALRYRWHNTGERATAVWTLTSCEYSDAPPAGVEGLTRDFPDTGLGRLARRVLQPGDDAPERLSHEEFVTLSDAARDAGRPDDAALLLLESSLQDGSNVTPQIRALMSDADAAKSIRALMGSISRANSEPQEGVAELDAMDRAKFTRPAILDVFRANGFSNMGRTDDAVTAFLTALNELPWLSAAYCDLGQALHRGFRTSDAWLAWEIGRVVGPDHPTWASVQRLEQHVNDTYGELL